MALHIVNALLILLAIIATVVVVRRKRGGRLAVRLLVVWFVPIIGPLAALFRSKEPMTPHP